MGEKKCVEWFGHMERNKSEEFVKKVYVSETKVPRRRGKSVLRRKDRMKECMHERVADRGRGILPARKERVDSVRWRLFCSGHPLG